MNNQFFGDERDFYKYALLRVLSDGGKNSIGVCWLLTECGTSGGDKLGYLRSDSYKMKDPELFCFLRNCICEQKIRDVSVMDDKIIPGAKYFSQSFPAWGDRVCYFEQAAQELGGSVFLFIDPDTGIHPKSLKGAKFPNGHLGEKENQYIRSEEIERMWKGCEESSLVIFQFFHPANGKVKNEKRLREIMQKLECKYKPAFAFCCYQFPVAYYFMLRAEHKGIVHCKMDEIERLGFSTLPPSTP